MDIAKNQFIKNLEQFGDINIYLIIDFFLV